MLFSQLGSGECSLKGVRVSIDHPVGYDDQEKAVARSGPRIAREVGATKNIPVLIEPIANNGFRATGGLPFAITVEGATRDEALG